MAQFATTAGSRSSAGAVTVADILSRNAPVPVKILGSQTTPPLSVGNLLRREGHATADEPTTVTAGETAPPRMVVRRGALAAGAVLAAGSAFGFTLLHPTVPVADHQSLAGPYAGQGILDGTAPAAPAAAPVVIAPAAARSGLDAGMSAPTSWAPVAFPGGATGTGGTTDAAATPAGSGRAAPAAPTRAPQAASVPPPSATGGGSPGNPGPTGPPSPGAGTGTDSSAPARTAPEAVQGPVARTVHGMGDTVTSTGTALGRAVDSVAAPVGSLLGGLL